MSNFWEKRRILVTGATGIIGSWLIKELLDLEAHVVAFIRDADPQSELFRSGDIRKISVVNGSLEDFWAVERSINEHEVDLVFHLGAQTIVGTSLRFPLPTFDANIKGTYNLLEACRFHRDLVQGVVVASSDKAYGGQPNLPYTEDMPLLGRHPYEVSKSCADLIAQSYYHSYDLPVAIARWGNVYGGGDLNWSRIVPGTIRSFYEGKRPVIRSDGTFVREYIYVQDTVLGYMRLAERLDDAGVKGEAFNFGTGKPVTVMEIVKAIQERMNCGHLTPDIRDEAKAEIHSQYLSFQKAYDLLGWEPKYDLETGLASTIAWYRNFLDDHKEAKK